MPEVLKPRPRPQECITKISTKEGAIVVQVTGKDGSPSGGKTDRSESGIEGLQRHGEVQALDVLKGALAPAGEIFDLKVGGITTSSESAGRGTVNIETWCGN